VSSRWDNAVTNFDAAKTASGNADSSKTFPKDADRRLAEPQSTEFDLIITVDCGLEFGPM
jgi:hypothetical protein